MYSEILNQPVPQTRPLNERQVQNNAGGFSYAVDQWDQLDRFFLLGTLGGTYYLTANDLTKQNFEPVLACVSADGTRVVQRAVEISRSGRAVKNEPAIFVLALVFKMGDEKPARPPAKPCPASAGPEPTSCVLPQKSPAWSAGGEGPLSAE